MKLTSKIAPLGLRGLVALAAVTALPLSAEAQPSFLPNRLDGEPPTVQPCPPELPAGARCLRGRDYLGATQWIALPAQWNQRLVLQLSDGPLLGETEGGPIARLTPPKGADVWRQAALWLQTGHAWASVTPRQGGLETLAEGEDAERARKAVVAEAGEPEYTLLLGQGYGAAVALRMAERFTTPDFHPRKPMRGKRPYDALLLVNGWLAGPKVLDQWLDLKVVYQAVCHNDPANGEVDYPLWRGLPLPPQADAEAIAQSQRLFAERFGQCTGLGTSKPSAAQQKALGTLSAVLKLPPLALLPRMLATRVQMHDLVWRKFKGANPFGNEGVRYQGSNDDNALNAQVARYKPDAGTASRLVGELSPSGSINLPIVTLGGMGSSNAAVEQVSELQDVLLKASRLGDLLATAYDDRVSAQPPDTLLLSAAHHAFQWAASGQRPTARALLDTCRKSGSASACPLLPDHAAADLSTRIAARPLRNPVSAGPVTVPVTNLPANAPAVATPQAAPGWQQPLQPAFGDTPNPAGDMPMPAAPTR